MRWVTRWQTRVDTYMAYVAAFFALAIVLLASGDVICRYFFNNPITGAYELSEVLLALIIFLAFPYVQYLKGHMSIGFLYERYPPKVARIFDIVILVLAVATFGLMTRQGVALFLSSLRVQEISEGLLPFPIYPFKFVMPLGFALLTLRCFSQLIENLSQLGRSRGQSL